MKRTLAAIAIGSALVAVAKMLDHSLTTGPFAFLMLWPGIMLGALAPDSGYNPEGDVHPWGPISLLIVYAVDIALYSGLAWIALSLAARPTLRVTAHAPNPSAR